MQCNNQHVRSQGLHRHTVESTRYDFSCRMSKMDCEGVGSKLRTRDACSRDAYDVIDCLVAIILYESHLLRLELQYRVSLCISMVFTHGLSRTSGLHLGLACQAGPTENGIGVPRCAVPVAEVVDDKAYCWHGPALHYKFICHVSSHSDPLITFSIA